MAQYPINLNLKNKKCLIAGGGRVAARKAMRLLECGAKIVVVSPILTERLKESVLSEEIEWKRRKYKTEDLKNCFMVIAATNSKDVNLKISDDAKKMKILCNIADSPENGDFTLPAIIRRGEMMITISTSGSSPALSRVIRKKLEHDFGPEYSEAIDLLKRIRTRLLEKDHDPEGHKKLFREILDCGLVDLIKKQNDKKLMILLEKVFGKEICNETICLNQLD